MLWSEEIYEKNSDKTAEEDYFERLFWNIWNNNVQILGSEVAEDREAERTYRTAANTSDVNDLILSQKGAPQTHLTSWQVARKAGMHPLSVVHIIGDDLRLEVCEKTTRTGAVRNQSKLYQLFATKIT